MDELQIISSSKLSEHPNVVFGFSTRLGGVSPEPYGLNLSHSVEDDPGRVVENRKLFFGKLGIGLDELAIPEQCHSTTVRNVYHPGGYEKCDALATKERRVFLVVSVADCVPMFIYDPIRNVVATVHVGWRGSASGIVRETLGLLSTEFSTIAADLIVYLGPSARSCCYEVGDEVAKKFPAYSLRLKSTGKFFLDLHTVSKTQLIDNGVKDDRIEEDGRCTICSPGVFHSYRRDGPQSGRMMGVIGLLR